MKQNLRTFLVLMLCAAWCPTWVLADEATLPFTFEGTKADIATTAGLSESGLGPDNYSNPYLQFDDTGDCVILHFNERPGTLSFDLMGRNFSGGSFTVQASEDGVNYTDLRTYNNFGPSPHMLRGIFDDLDTDVRYIKWIYTEKVEGNVFLGRIRLDEFSTHPDLYISDVTIKAGEDQPLEVHTLSDGALSFNSENNDIAWVEFVDGAVLAQLSPPDMRLPIQFALYETTRLPGPTRWASARQTSRYTRKRRATSRRRLQISR